MDKTTQGILDVARSVLAELDLDVVLERVLEAAQELTEARYAALGVLNDSKTELSRFLTKGIDEAAHASIGAPPRGRGVLGALIRDPVPLRLAHVGDHPGSYGFPPGHPPMSTFLGVPIIVHGTPYGNLYLTEKAHGAEFSEADEQAVCVLAEFAGVAIDHARRYAGERARRDELERFERQRQRLAAAESERHRWARELHDDTLQSLSALRIGLSVAGRSEDLATVKQALGEAVDQLEEGISNLRALITDLRPTSLDELGAQAAIEALAERSTRHGIDVDVCVELAQEQGRVTTRHTPEVEIALYRIVQEALNNATKHGHARRAVVEIHEDGPNLQLSVSDDGEGFDVRASRNGFGLLGMKERISLLGGDLRVDSTPGKGTTIKARIPVRERVQAPAARGSRRGWVSAGVRRQSSSPRKARASR